MSDITKCKGTDCPIKNSCYRYTATANPNYQSYFVNVPFHNNTCDNYIRDWEVKDTMRVALDNGNGMMCDNCGTLVMPKSKRMVKCMCVSPSEDDKKASTGVMQNVGTVDLCIDCYNKLLGSIVHKPRKPHKEA